MLLNGLNDSVHFLFANLLTALEIIDNMGYNKVIWQYYAVNKTNEVRYEIKSSRNTDNHGRSVFFNLVPGREYKL